MCSMFFLSFFQEKPKVMSVNESQEPNCVLGGKSQDFWLSNENIVPRLISYVVPGRVNV